MPRPRARAAAGTPVLALMLTACGSVPPPGSQPPQSRLEPPAPGPQAALPHPAPVGAGFELDPSFESRSLAEARAHLQALPRTALEAERRRLRLTIGRALLRLGHIEEAVAELTLANREPVPETLHALAVAEMRLGETRNCVARHNPASCLWPLEAAAWHQDREGSTRAIAHLEDWLAVAPGDPLARWLLNLSWMTLGGWPDRVPQPLRLPSSLFASREAFPRFANVALGAGLGAPLLSGGAVAGDFDHDGDLDLLRSTVDPRERLRAYRNDGSGQFALASEAAGLGGIAGGLNMVTGDFDNDGNLDVLVLRGAWMGRAGRLPRSLLLGQGDGSFVERGGAAGLRDPSWPSQAAAVADYDRDGLLDVFIGNESGADLAAPSQLFRNQGDGTFQDVAAEAGVADFAFTKGAAWGELDGDGWPDLYVSNLGGPNRLYRNGRDGGFQEQAHVLGVGAPARSFACGWLDFDQDGAQDLIVLPYEPDTRALVSSWLGQPSAAEGPRLYRNEWPRPFRDASVAMGLGRPVSAMGANVGDLDGDGWPDLYIGTGSPELDALMPNLFYRNRGGQGFLDLTVAAGLGHLQKGHAVVFGDFDGDGDVDLYAAMGGAWPVDLANDALFENPGFGGHWLGVELTGTRSNRAAIGARLRLTLEEGSGRRQILRWIDSGLSFGANPLAPVIGIGAATRIERLEITWPAGDEVEILEELAVDRWLKLREP